MNSNDNPEDRIRELEKSLHDSSRAAEAGGSQPTGYEHVSYEQTTPYAADYPPPPTEQFPPQPGGYPPPPPGSYPPPRGGFDQSFQQPYPQAWNPQGQPYPPAYVPPRRSGSGLKLFLILGGVFVVLTAIIATGIFLIGSKVRSAGGSDIFGDRTSSPTIKIPTFPSFSIPPPPTFTQVPDPSVVPPGGQISVSGFSQTRDITCDGHTVNVSGVSNTVVITGNCARVVVSGVTNVVTVDSSDEISASGFDNRVTYRTGNPTITNVGDANIIEQG